MSKVGKTFTVDLENLVWLQNYARQHRKKESAIVNEMLTASRRTDQTWECPECQAVNDNQFQTCHSCPHVLVKA
jgi:hypothetical protein